MNHSGQTRRASTTTEAESYLRLAFSTGLLPTSDDAFMRATTEDHALDSYQNLLFSIARFHEYTGRYPSRITVVGYEMKRRRFTDLHRAALRWPEDNFDYVGIDAEGEELSKAREGEVSNFPPLSNTVLTSFAAEEKRLPSIYAGHLRMPRCAFIQETVKKPLHPLPSLFYVGT